MKTISIQTYRQNGSKVFSGRDVGIDARRKLELNEKDIDEEQYEIIIPEDTYSIGGSFFGGLFSDSVIKLGEEGFRKKYIFKFANSELNDSLRGDIEEGIYDAINDL